MLTELYIGSNIVHIEINFQYSNRGKALKKKNQRFDTQGNDVIFSFSINFSVSFRNVPATENAKVIHFYRITVRM